MLMESLICVKAALHSSHGIGDLLGRAVKHWLLLSGCAMQSMPSSNVFIPIFALSWKKQSLLRYSHTISRTVLQTDVSFQAKPVTVAYSVSQQAIQW